MRVYQSSPTCDCSGSAQSADTPPPAKEGWQHSDMVLVWYPSAPEAGKIDRFGIAYYHYNPPFEGARVCRERGKSQRTYYGLANRRSILLK